MTDSRLNTLIYLIQWRVDAGMPLKDAYNTVVTNFVERVTEDERQELLNYFIPVAYV